MPKTVAMTAKIPYFIQSLPNTLIHEALFRLSRSPGPEGVQLNSHLSSGVTGVGDEEHEEY